MSSPALIAEHSKRPGIAIPGGPYIYPSLINKDRNKPHHLPSVSTSCSLLERWQEEYKYNFAREQQLAQDQSRDALAKIEKELSERKTTLERDWAEREKTIAAREDELTQLRARSAGFAEDLKAAADDAAAETAARLEQQHKAAEELLKRQSDGERNVLSAKITALERTVKDQAEQLTRLQEQAEKAYAQVQEIAVRAIEGSASAKQLAHLQQLLADQTRKVNQPER